MRDERGLKRCAASRTLLVDTRTGAVVSGVFCPFATECTSIGKHLIAISREAYLWITDETRDRNVVTAADLYDTVRWTKDGITIGGEFVRKEGGKEVRNG